MKTNSLKSALLLGILSLQVGAFAQEQVPQKKQLDVHDHIIHKSFVGPDGKIRCHTMEMDSIRRAMNPNLPTLEQEEIALQQEIARYKARQLNGEAKKLQYTIPVIFHIFTDGSGAENLSAARIQAQLDQLNLDYADQSGSPYQQSADVEIQFCLAEVDEGGAPLAEPGINRVTSYGDGPFSSNDFDNGMKQATIWDPNDYFNVWVADLSGGLLGYAQFPSSSGLAGMPTNGGSANTDGCVILYSSVGSVANPAPGGPYNLGRTLTHEAGHWLGLRHIWGDDGGACSGSDFCADTPNAGNSTFGCPSNPSSCSSADMIENYMDYSNDACMNTFTEDQKTRMLTVMAVSPRRASLANSNACSSSTAVDDIGVTAITHPSGTICGESFDPQVTVTNFGSNTVTSFTVNYDIDGGANQTDNWTGTLPAGQSTTVVLPNTTTTTGPHTFNASTSSPNGNSDTDPSNDGDSEAFTLNGSGADVTLTLDTDCYGEETVYELYDSGNNLIYSGGNQNVTLPVTAQQNTNATDPGAFASETTITIEWCLTVDECYEFTIWDAYGDGMHGSQWNGCSTDGDFEITDNQGVTLAALQAADSDFGFSETANFCISSTGGGVGLDELSSANFKVYPNPGNGVFNVSLNENVSGEVQVAVYDVTGRVVLEDVQDQDVFTLDMTGAATGTYTVSLQTSNGTMTKRVIVK